eukprot:1160731-Pelagomonas_calceolata.AAC.4
MRSARLYTHTTHIHTHTNTPEAAAAALKSLSAMGSDKCLPLADLEADLEEQVQPSHLLLGLPQRQCAQHSRAGAAVVDAVAAAAAAAPACFCFSAPVCAFSSAFCSCAVAPLLPGVSPGSLSALRRAPACTHLRGCAHLLVCLHLGAFPAARPPCRTAAPLHHHALPVAAAVGLVAVLGARPFHAHLWNLGADPPLGFPLAAVWAPPLDPEHPFAACSRSPPARPSLKG